MHKPLQACTQLLSQGCLSATRVLCLIQDLVLFFRAETPLWLMLAWKSLLVAVSWTLNCSDHVLVTCAEEEEGGRKSRRKQKKWNLCRFELGSLGPDSSRMFKHSCAMSCNLASAAAPSLHPSITQPAQAPGACPAPSLVSVL